MVNCEPKRSYASNLKEEESGLILKAVYGKLRTEEVLRLKFERGGISP